MGQPCGLYLGAGVGEQVTLRGAGMELTAVYFKEQQPSNATAGFTAAPGSYINYNSSGRAPAQDMLPLATRPRN